MTGGLWRTLRAVTVAATTWLTAGVAPLGPSAFPLAAAAAAGALGCAALYVWRREAVFCVLAIALACAAATAGCVVGVEPTRAQVAALQAQGGRHLEVSATVTGHLTSVDSGDLWFDAVVNDVRAGDMHIAGAIPARIGVASASRDAVSRAGPGSNVSLSGRGIPATPGERALIVVRADRVAAAPPPTGGWAWFDDLRDGLMRSTHGLPQPGAGLIPGLAVGDTSGLDGDTEEAMKVSSLSHLTAVSGANCAIVVAAAFALLGLCHAPRWLRISGAVAVLGGFVALVTPEPSVVRAATMAAIALLALALGRPAVGVSVLSAAVTAVLVVDPWMARSLGFALSAAATAALLVLARPLAAGLERWMPRTLALGLAVPTAAQLACGPLIVLIDPHVPLLGIAANLVADPAAAPATILGVLACIAPVPWLRDGLTALAWIPSSWIAAVARTTATMSVQHLPWADGPLGAGLLSVVGGAVVVAVTRPPRRRLRAFAAVVLAVAAGTSAGGVAVRTVAAGATVPADWQIAMCDVGQGDATLWRSGDDVALVDTGPDPQLLTTCLREFGVDRLALVILTHYDLDHVGGAAAIVGRADLVVHGPVGDAGDARLLRDFEENGARVENAVISRSGAIGATRWTVLGPPENATPGNDASVVVDVTGSGFPRTLLLGDLGARAQAALARRVDVPRVDVVKVSHHGSRDQDAELYRRLHPRLGLIGVGADNRYGHPTASILSLLAAEGATVARTDTGGALAAWNDGDGRLVLWTQHRGDSPQGATPQPAQTTARRNQPRNRRRASAEARTRRYRGIIRHTTRVHRTDFSSLGMRKGMSMSQAFRERELTRIERSGWVQNEQIRALLDETGLPAPVDALSTFMSPDRWEHASRIEKELREHFAEFRFSTDVEYGVLLVPTPSLLDTRGAFSAVLRGSLHPRLGEDFVDPSLDAGIDSTSPTLAWTPFVSVVGPYGVSAGSYDNIVSAPSDRFTVGDVDTRKAMTRQLWGARLLQSPPGVIPDSDHNATWTFTLFPAESLADGKAVSATVLQGKVRFRVGRTDRGIGSARISPAIPIP